MDTKTWARQAKPILYEPMLFPPMHGQVGGAEKLRQTFGSRARSSYLGPPAD